MATLIEYALMSNAAYFDIRGLANRPVIPEGWTRLDRTWTATPVATILAGSAGDDGLYGDDNDILQKQAA